MNHWLLPPINHWYYPLLPPTIVSYYPYYISRTPIFQEIQQGLSPRPMSGATSCGEGPPGAPRWAETLRSQVTDGCGDGRLTEVESQGLYVNLYVKVWLIHQLLASIFVVISWLVVNC